ncbi:phospholipase D-like domain-containing protein, partial [Pantanalinema rosaneae CENA516]|uniref:phospholipase D-like domain-containing protein n=1 Tax=Pantanalinema rosaneae TaxID=1620701 RepID=UPI003D6FFCEA
MIDHQHWVFLVPVTLFIVDNSIRLISILVVPRNRTPSSGTAWLLFILLAPIPGIILFWLIGGTRMPRRRRERQFRAIELMSDIAERDAQQFGSDLGTLPLGLGNAEKLGLALGAQPMFRGNHATVSHISEDSLSLMATEIRAASTFVHIEFYILSYDDSTHDVFDAIREATSRGVTVRVMLDHIATMRQPRPSDTTRKLDAVGAEWTYMLPVRPWRGQWQRPDLRNHRKILVVDGVVGFIGSQNMVDSSYNKRGNIRRGLQWRDIMVRLTGPSVSSLNRVFMSDWYQDCLLYT